METVEKPILVFDRNSELGQFITDGLSQENLCVFVSAANSNHSKRIIHVPLAKRIPTVPKCVYKTFILYLNNDKTVLDLLPFFVKKAAEDNAHIYLIINVREASEKLVSQVLDNSHHITALIMGDAFGEGISSHNPVAQLITQGNSGRLLLENALSYVYPVSITDIVSVIKQLISLRGIPGHRVIYLLPPHPMTRLSFARQLHKKEPLLKIDIRESDDHADKMHSPSYMSVFGPGYDFSKKLPKVEINNNKKSARMTHRRINRGFSFSFRRLFFVLFFSLIISVFGLPVFTALIGAGFLSRTQAHVSSGEIEKARPSANAARVFFSFSRQSARGLTLFSYVGLGRQVESLSSGIYTGELVSSTVLSGIDGIISLKKVFFTESVDPKKDLSVGIQGFKAAVLGVSSMRAEDKIPQKYKKYETELDRLSQLTNGFFDVLPELVGMDEKKKYLVLFQNNMELRPGGGFIGSYGILELDKGRIVEFPIHDVYDADGQLREHIEPPFQLRRYLGANHWYLRDSNFDLDFEKNGASAAFFYNAETKGTVDGVIAIDTTFLKKLLSVTGPISVSGYNEKVTSDNFFKLTESYAQDNFFPGSNQKQNFLNAVAVSLFSRLQLPKSRVGEQTGLNETKDVSYAALMGVVTESIFEKHLLFAFPDDNIQRAFSINGASSSLVDARTEEEGTFNDFLGINEANIGMNKSNFYLDRSISHIIRLDADGKAVEQVSVHYFNKSKSADKYGGDYKSYLRLILPKGAELRSISFDKKEQETTPAIVNPAVFTAPGFTPKSGLEVERTELGGKTVYGFLNIVPSGKKKTVTVTYDIKTDATSNNQVVDYSLRIFKQPGTGGDAYALSFIHPENYKVLNTTKNVRVTDSSTSFLTNLLEDKLLEVKLGRK